MTHQDYLAKPPYHLDGNDRVCDADGHWVYACYDDDEDCDRRYKDTIDYDHD